jgi:hypothetical protein
MLRDGRTRQGRRDRRHLKRSDLGGTSGALDDETCLGQTHDDADEWAQIRSSPASRSQWDQGRQSKTPAQPSKIPVRPSREGGIRQ